MVMRKRRSVMAREMTVEERRLVEWLRRDVGLHLERYYERLRVAEEIERGDHMAKVKVAATVPDPPTLQADDIARIQQESQRLHEAADDFKVRVK